MVGTVVHAVVGTGGIWLSFRGAIGVGGGRRRVADGNRSGVARGKVGGGSKRSARAVGMLARV